MLEKIFGASPQVIEMLREDHQRVNDCFARFKKERGRHKTAAAREAMKELEVHAQIEEKIVYPAFRQCIDPHLIDEGVEEHHLVHVLLRELKALKPGAAAFDAKFTVMSELVQHHAEEEERELFPKASAKDLDWNKLYARAQALRRRRRPKSGRTSAAKVAA